MIRKYMEDDIQEILEIWLSASIKAHAFIEPSFWESQVANMRDIYIPSSQTYVYEKEDRVLGFCSLLDNTIAAIFVSPTFQGQGIGKKLINHAKENRSELSLSVYKENKASIQFYLSQGFQIVSEQQDVHTGKQECVMKYPTKIETGT